MVGNVQGSIQALQQNGALASQTAGIGLNNSLVQGQYHYNSAVHEAQGIEAQLQLQQVTENANLEIDLLSTAAKDSLLLSGKALEMSTLIAQTREKIMGAFAAITEARTATTWSNIKKLTQGFKF